VDLNEISHEAKAALAELVEVAHLQENDIVVIGCSTSEVHGARIGTSTSMDVAMALYAGWESVAKATGIALAFQCCEHINRAVVVNAAIANRWDLELVQAIPVPKAGGAMATLAYHRVQDAVVVESIQQRACAGLDVGDTLIGMHIHPVVVPLRLSHKSIGSAHLQAAMSRRKLIGGQRAVYDYDEALAQARAHGYRAE